MSLLEQLEGVIDELDIFERNYREIYNNAIDIDDIEVAQKTLSDTLIKIRKIKEIKDTVKKISNDLEEYEIVFDDDSEKNNVKEEVNNVNCDYINKEDNMSNARELQLDISDYVRSKMRQLSNKGYAFTENEIMLMAEKIWSKDILELKCAFVKIYDERYTLDKQIKDNLGINKYWKEIFQFGNYKLLLTNQWYEKNRDKFNNWYDTLNVSDNHIDNKYTDKKPCSIKLFNKTYSVRDWKEILIKVCEIMLLRAPYEVSRFDKIEKLNSNRQINFSYNQKDIQFNPKRLSNGLWMETNRNADDIVKVSQEILNLCGFNENELVINYK